MRRRKRRHPHLDRKPLSTTSLVMSLTLKDATQFQQRSCHIGSQGLSRNLQNSRNYTARKFRLSAALTIPGIDPNRGIGEMPRPIPSIQYQLASGSTEVGLRISPLIYFGA